MRIERDIIHQFKAWKEAPDRKPILLKGARQVGKTWAMETFGKERFKYCVKAPYYWTSPGTAEVEFVIQWDDEIIPVEVKAEENISGSSLSVYFKTYSPRYRMRFSMLNLQYNCGLLSSPAPLAGWLDKWMALTTKLKIVDWERICSWPTLISTDR